MTSSQITDPVELFEPPVSRYGEVTLLDCNDSFTHNIVESLLKLGAPVRVFRSHLTTTDEVVAAMGSYLVLSPGPGTPDEAGIAKELFTEVRGEVPVLGICLGMQAINEVLGGRTVPAPVVVHGKVSEIHHDGTGVFSGLPSPTPVARYHSLVVDPVKVVEVQSLYKGVVMAFRVPSLRTAAVQFHPESFLTVSGIRMLENFLEGSF